MYKDMNTPGFLKGRACSQGGEFLLQRPVREIMEGLQRLVLTGRINLIRVERLNTNAMVKDNCTRFCLSQYQRIQTGHSLWTCTFLPLAQIL